MNSIFGASKPSILGGGSKTLRQCAVYANTKVQPTLSGTLQNIGADLTGTVTTSGSSKILTGSGTSFTSELAAGDWIKTSVGNVKIVSIQSDTALTLATAVNISSGEAIKKYQTTLSGTNTAFDEDYAVGEYIQVGAEDSTQICRILSIASATSMDVIFGQEHKKDIDRVILADTDKTHRKFTAVYLGDSQSVTFTANETGEDLSGQEEGAKADHVLTDGEYMLAMEACEMSPERLSIAYAGHYLYRSASTGEVKGGSFAQPQSTSLRDIANELTVIGYEKGAKSTDNLMILKLPMAAPQAQSEWQFARSGQQVVSINFMCFPDDEAKDPIGRPVYAYYGEMDET